jgi:hypothetical protein
VLALTVRFFPRSRSPFTPVISYFFFSVVIVVANKKTFKTVDFDTFSKILNRPGGFREPFDIEEYIRGFQVFDKDRSGFVGKGQIKYILTNLGEKMSEEEVDELFKSTIDASNNEVDYRGEFFFLLLCNCTCVQSKNYVRIAEKTNMACNRVCQDDCGELETRPFVLGIVYSCFPHT